VQNLSLNLDRASLGSNSSSHNLNPAGKQLLKLVATLPALLLLDRAKDLMQ
jgi:hypothetical protein